MVFVKDFWSHESLYDEWGVFGDVEVGDALHHELLKFIGRRIEQYVALNWHDFIRAKPLDAMKEVLCDSDLVRPRVEAY